MQNVKSRRRRTLPLAMKMPYRPAAIAPDMRWAVAIESLLTQNAGNAATAKSYWRCLKHANTTNSL